MVVEGDKSDDISKQFELLTKSLERVEKDTEMKFSSLVDNINLGFEDIRNELNNITKYFAKRHDDVDSRLSKIESDMRIVRSTLTSVSNWTKTSDNIFQLTRTHAYEIPKIEVRLKKLEDGTTYDSSKDNHPQ